jgi:hypothetical protein
MRSSSAISGAVIFSAVPSFTSTDKSVCATPSCRSAQVLLEAKAGVAQTLLSVLSQGAAADIEHGSVRMTRHA